MLAHQLDLFGSPLKPPKKIKVDDDIPVEEPKPVAEEQTTMAAEPINGVLTDVADHIVEYMGQDDSVPSNNPGWMPSETGSDFNESIPEEIAENEEIIATESYRPNIPSSLAVEPAIPDEPFFTNEIPGTGEDEISEPDEAAEEEPAFTDEAISINEIDEFEQPATLETNDFITEEPLTEDVPASPSNANRGRKSIHDYEEESDGLNVPPDEELFKRQYYSMRETSTMFGVNQSLLRFWENEFDILQPKKNKKGDRYFRPVDIKNLVLIYHLLRVRKFTMEGAKDYLQSHKKAGDTFELIKRLEKLKSFLFELKAGL